MVCVDVGKNQLHLRALATQKNSSATDASLPSCDGQKKRVSIVTRDWSKGRGRAVAM